MRHPTPRVSILIPNFNNGRESSHDGCTDFIGDLFRSLEETLRHERTPFEIIVHDDGSTDDSLDTCREWSRKTWPDGPPFLTLTERPHCGVLSITANNMTREARGEFCCRLDGDIVILTPNWVSKVVEAFERGQPRLGVIGPKQLMTDMRIHSAGDFLLHPRGYHHVAQGAPRGFITRSIEVDHVMGCFYCHRKEVWEEIGGYDEQYLRGQTVDFGMSARLRGWRTFSVPHIEFIHRHSLRKARQTKADTDDGVDLSRKRFEEKWGFDRIAPDLDLIRTRYSGTPLLWNATVFGPAAEPAAAAAPIAFESSEWVRFGKDEAFQQSVRARLEIVGQMARIGGPRRRILQIGCGTGLVCHLIAREGIPATGVDADRSAIRLARHVTTREAYPAQRPAFLVHDAGAPLPVASASADTVLLFDIIERHPNPVALLREAHRVLQENGLIAIVSRKRQGVFEGELEGVHWFRAHELQQLMLASRCFANLDVGPVSHDPSLLRALGRKRISCSAAEVKPAPTAVFAASP